MSTPTCTIAKKTADNGNCNSKMIEFKVSVPGNLSLFGEHAVKHDRAGLMSSIDLRTTLIFKETSNSVIFFHVYYPQDPETLKIPLKEFLKFYNYCVQDIESLYNKVLQYSTVACKSSNHTIIVRAFFYLLTYIVYKEQIEIKAFNMQLFTEFLIGNEFACTASITVSLVACFLNWSRLQKGTCDDIDIKKIKSYATHYEEISYQSGIIDVVTCLYGSVTQYQNKRITRILEGVPNMSILLVDSKQDQCLDAQVQLVTELMNTVPEEVEYIFKCINHLTQRACDAFLTLFDVYHNIWLEPETKHRRICAQLKVLETCIRLNQNLLNALNVSHPQLDNICSIARKHGMCGKYTDIGNGRFAYIWCPQLHVNECTHMEPLADELTMQGFHVRETNFAYKGMRIESLEKEEVENLKFNLNDEIIE